MELKKENIILISKDICIVHIPKTAGTSLRGIISRKFKDSHSILFDYGENSPTTSSILIEYLYSNKIFNKNSFNKFLRKDKPLLVFGHFPATKYINFLNNPNIHTFLRDPFQRFLSEFIHHREIYGKDLKFIDALTDDEFCNVIDSYFDGFKIEDFTSIGNSDNFILDIQNLLKIENKKINIFDKLKFKFFKENTSKAHDKVAYVINNEPSLLNKSNLKNLFERYNFKDQRIYNQYLENKF